MPEIAIKRLSDVRGDGYRTYRIYLDGRRVGKIRAGEELRLPISPGKHRLQLRIDWTASQKLEFEIGEDDGADFVCKPGWTTPWEAFKLMTWGRKRYINLQRVV